MRLRRIGELGWVYGVTRHEDVEPAQFASELLCGKPAGAWNRVILSGDRFRRRLAPRLADFFEQLAFSAGPVLERISGRVTALQIDMVGAQRDLFRCRMDPGGLRLSHHWQGAVLRLGHTLLLPTAASILHLVESNSIGNHWRGNRKFQYFKSRKRTPLGTSTPALWF